MFILFKRFSCATKSFLFFKIIIMYYKIIYRALNIVICDIEEELYSREEQEENSITIEALRDKFEELCKARDTFYSLHCENYLDYDKDYLLWLKNKLWEK